jgi:hypothetical protein
MGCFRDLSRLHRRELQREGFTLSCLMSDPPNWWKMESSWKKRLRAKNTFLKSKGRTPLSRYHAADCSSLVNEFDGWSKEEQIEFTKQLLNVVEHRFLNVISYSLPLDTFVAVFPEHKDDLCACYALLLKFMMLEFVDQVESAKKKLGHVKPVKVVLFYDRCACGTQLLEAFNSLMNDEGFRGRHIFSTIAPMSWDDCIPLQLADLLAYENFKDTERHLTGRKRRKTLELLLAGGLGGRSKRMNEDNVRELRRLLEKRTANATNL